jgi:ABC-type transporter Mla subunit MlaD
MTNIISLILSQNVRSLAVNINGLFQQNEWQQDMDRVAGSLTEAPLLAQLQETLQKSLEKPMAEISSAVKSLARDQEQKLDNILAGTLTRFSAEMEKKTAADMANLTKTLKEAVSAAAQMKKHFSDKNSEFSKLMDKQSTALAKYLSDMQKSLKNSEKMTQKGAETLVKSLKSGLEDTYGKLGAFVQDSLKKIEDKQTALDAAGQDKDSILQDLHNTAKDLGTISNASGRLLEKFSRLSTDLDKVLTNIQESGVTRLNGGSEKRDQLKAALVSLKKANQDKICSLPDM